MNPRSLRARIAITTFALLAIVMAIALSQTLTTYQRGASELIGEIERSKLSILEAFASDALVTRQFAAFQPHLESLLAAPDISNALLVDDQGMVVASGEPSWVGTPVPALVSGEMGYWQTREVGQRDYPSGLLAVEFSTDRHEALGRSVRRQALFAGLAGTVLCAGISLLAAHALVRRLYRLVEAARRVSGGDLCARTGLAGGDEIGQLGRAFDRMVERLAGTHKALEDQQASLEQVVEERTVELRSAQASLLQRERLSALGELTASVSHELRNPLGTIGASLDILRREAVDLSPRSERAAERADRSISRCVRIIDDLKDYSSVHEPARSRFELDALLSPLLEPPDWPANVRTETALAGGTWVSADRDLLGKAVSHVLRNAAQAVLENDEVGPRSRVRICSMVDDGCAVIEISDDAGGIPEENLAKVFMPLFSTRAFGTGLGLPVARKIVEQNGGTLTIDSAQGRGTTVTARLPLAKPSQ